MSATPIDRGVTNIRSDFVLKQHTSSADGTTTDYNAPFLEFQDSTHGEDPITHDQLVPISSRLHGVNIVKPFYIQGGTSGSPTYDANTVKTGIVQYESGAGFQFAEDSTVNPPTIDIYPDPSTGYTTNPNYVAPISSPDHDYRIPTQTNQYDDLSTSHKVHFSSKVYDTNAYVPAPTTIVLNAYNNVHKDQEITNKMTLRNTDGQIGYDSNKIEVDANPVVAQHQILVPDGVHFNSDAEFRIPNPEYKAPTDADVKSASSDPRSPIQKQPFLDVRISDLYGATTFDNIISAICRRIYNLEHLVGEGKEYVPSDAEAATHSSDEEWIRYFAGQNPTQPKVPTTPLYEQ